MAYEKLKKTGDEIRAMSIEELNNYVTEAGPLHLRLMEEAEKIMEQARPLNDALFVARNRIIELGGELPYEG